MTETEQLESVRRRTISFVVPVYRNEGTLTRTHEQISELFKKGELTDYDYEMVFVDDGSDDGSFAELLTIRKDDPRVRIVSFTRNFGQMAAMLAGFREVTGDAMVTVSADLQDPIELVPEMVRQWFNGAELVICYRSHRDDSPMNKVTSSIAYRILRIAIPQIPAGGFDYVLLDRRVLDSFNSIDVRSRFFQGDILWFGYRTHFIPYRRLRRTIGKSQYNLAKRVRNFIDAFLDCSYLPIRLMSLTGVLTAIGGFLYALSVVWAWYAMKVPFAGWAPIIVLVLTLGGLNMLSLGILGEYVWRIFDEVRKKPNYVIRAKHL